MTSRINWDAADYARNSQGQFGWAMANLDKLALRGDETVLDVGCGDGKISVEIARRVPNGRVVGIDNSEVMIAAANEKALSTKVPNLTFQVMDGQALSFNEEFEAVFSNSAMHWMTNPQATVQGIARSLKQGGRIVLSMGGRGTAEVVFASLELMARDPRWQSYIRNVPSPHHFLGPEEYGPWLSAAGLAATRVALVHKPMRLAGISALQGWLRTTWMHYTERLPEDSRTAFLTDLADRVSQRCSTDEDGALLMPMVNLEVEARKGQHIELNYLFHITTEQEANDARRIGEYVPRDFQREGFIHCSYAHQVAATANRIFRGRRELVLLQIDPRKVGCRIVEENLEGGKELYPHVYGHLPITAVETIRPFPCGHTGLFTFSG